MMPLINFLNWKAGNQRVFRSSVSFPEKWCSIYYYCFFVFLLLIINSIFRNMIFFKYLLYLSGPHTSLKVYTYISNCEHLKKIPIVYFFVDRSTSRHKQSFFYISKWNIPSCLVGDFAILCQMKYKIYFLIILLYLHISKYEFWNSCCDNNWNDLFV